MRHLSLHSDMLQFQPDDKELEKSPHEQIRSIVAQYAQEHELPATNDFRLYHIRAVGSSGEDEESVIFTPEFLYVLDVGYPAHPAVSLSLNISGAGDPTFPDFSSYDVFSVLELSKRDLLFPAAAGRLMVRVAEGTDEPTVRQELSPYVKSVERLISGNELYRCKVRPFHELEVASEIEQNVAVVRYAELDHIVRLIDFGPGWRVDRVC